MQIWVDADACPGEIKEMLYRAAKRRQILVTLVANQVLSPPKSSLHLHDPGARGSQRGRSADRRAGRRRAIW